jgi:hypothetical protein
LLTVSMELNPSTRGAMRLICATLLGGATAGLLDQISAFASLVPHGATVIGILHYVASGAIGTRAFNGGTVTALLGLAVHFSLTTAMAGTFVALSRRFSVLYHQPWLSGIGYGVATFLLMNYVAVPLSAAPNWKAPTGWAWVQAVMGGCAYVGIPIAFITRTYLSRPAEDA